MSPLSILITVSAYFVLVFVISYFAGRNANNATFFTGNRQSRWYMVAFAMIGASISGVTFVSVPGMVATSGFGYLQLVIGFVVGQFFIAFILTPLFYRTGVTSIYQYLGNRFGFLSYKTGAWFFFISKILGAAVRLFLICAVLQLLAFGPLGIPFWLNVAISIVLVWLYTFKGGVKSIIWIDMLKTLCLIVSVILCIYFISKKMSFTGSSMLAAINDSPMSRIFHFDDVNHKQYFFKQFLAGIFTQIAMTGLDQDMMQRNLSCANYKESQKNMIVSIALQFFVIWGFLMLGVLLYLFARANGITATGDNIFPVVATGGYLPSAVGILFILGFIAAGYSAAGSALTALTTSFTVDIIGTKEKSEIEVNKMRKNIHMAMAVLMGVVIIIVKILNNTSVVDAVYTLASYTYGPILGMFAFGILTKRVVKDKYMAWVAVVAPMICLVLNLFSEQLFNGYHFSYEILIFNAAFTFVGMWLISKKRIKRAKE